MSTKKKSPSRPVKRPAAAAPPPSPSRRSGQGAYIALIVAAVVVVIGVIAVVVTRSGDDSSDAGPQTYPVQVTGTTLPVMPQPPEADPGVGQPAPALTGQSLFGGTPLSITPGGGTPQMLVFLAHWCPHCQREVPVLVDWMASGQKPAELEVVGISTANNRSDQNSPASEWLQREGWTAPVLADSDDDTAAEAYGLPSFPYMVLIDGDGNVQGRASGELTPEQLTQFATTGSI